MHTQGEHSTATAVPTPGAPLVVVSEDVLLGLLDHDPAGTLTSLKAGRSPAGLAVALCYGKDLPNGEEFGSRTGREAWLLAERARNVRRQAMQIVVDEFSEAEMVEAYRLAGGSTGAHRPLLRRMVREWHTKNHARIAAAGFERLVSANQANRDRAAGKVPKGGEAA